MRSPITRIIFALFVATTVAMAGCGGDAEDSMDADTTGMAMDDMEQDMEQTAVAELSPTEGHAAMGRVTFTSMDGGASMGGGVRVQGDLSGLAPGMHGFHVHETGDCSAADGSSAGGHFNPTGQPHGAPDDDQRHVGDLGNIEAGSDSTASISMTDDMLSLSGPNSIVGKAVIVHGGQDDLSSQPSGDAGPRVACGVIEEQGTSQAAMQSMLE